MDRTTDHMPIVHLIRHAKAKGRDQWDGGDDAERPLKKSGRRQALQLAEQFADPAPGLIISSPAVRCIETITPLAERFSCSVTVDDLYFEGRRIVLPEIQGVAVICAHGDNIPDLLGRLKLQWYQCAKASTWRLELDDDQKIIDAQYIEPPQT